jgi:Outer membrane protein beta-barrel domain
MRSAGACAVLLLVPLSTSPAFAQGQAFGIGGRFSLVRGDVQADTTAQRFTGGQIRARMSPRSALEVSLDRRTDTNEAFTERVRESPIQASLLLYPLRTVLSPYVLGGGGWYSHRIDTLQDKKVVTSETTREFGWHAGFGGELRLGRHAGAHADYRYTFLHFGDDDTTSGKSSLVKGAAEGETGVSRFLPSYRGSMWTAGLTVYF